MGIGDVAAGLALGKKYRIPRLGTSWVEVKEIEPGKSIVAQVQEGGTFHKFVCPGDDIMRTDWVEVT